MTASQLDHCSCSSIDYGQRQGAAALQVTQPLFPLFPRPNVSVLRHRVSFQFQTQSFEFVS